jgi:AraC-like DNA-binding protein
MNPPTTVATLLLALYRHVAACGHDADALFARAGVDSRLFLQPGARVRSDAVNRVWLHAEEATGDECLGLEVGRRTHPSAADALGYAWLASVTLRDAMTRLARYMRVFAGIARVGFRQGAGGAELVFGPPDLPAGRHDSFFSSAVAYCRASYGDAFRPRALALARPAPRDTARHAALFGCEIAFGAKESVMWLADADLDARLPTGNPEIAAMTEQMLEKQLAKLDRSDVVARTRASILDALPSGSPSEESIARALALSQRTLQRRLSGAGTSFGGVLDTTRRDLAFHHLANPARQISEVAYLLGFAEAASFNRAFRRWTGLTPTEYRAALGMRSAAVDTAAGSALESESPQRLAGESPADPPEAGTPAPKE